jgi:hypothetical protein
MSKSLNGLSIGSSKPEFGSFKMSLDIAFSSYIVFLTYTGDLASRFTKMFPVPSILTLLNYQVLPTHFGGILGYIQIRELQRHQCRMAIMVFQWLHLLHLEQVLPTCQTTIIKAELEAT